jgi:hypothetical protein
MRRLFVTLVAVLSLASATYVAAQAAFNVFNLLNGGSFSEYNRSGANRIYSPSTYGTGTTLQEARGYQINGVFRF